MSKPAETELYAPVKTLFEARGYAVKGEIGGADLMARRDGEEPVIVELKSGFSLILLQQAAARQAITERVYVAVPRWSGKAGWRVFKGNIGLCRRLGIGVISVDLGEGAARVHAEPGPFRPRRSKPRRAAMLREFDAREGDPTAGGTNGQVMTAYRQDALRCAACLAEVETARGADVARASGVARATRIMADNHHGWFRRVAHGVYALSDAGAEMIAAAPPP
ncbi:hypothetical protein D6850_11665 [Roseovarius spongiae]|uniref:Uncharacterized protein n=1 Tax=Roseovarius spongiae TaxID=2320272 RepID=A0A3A8AVG8_9RHOB|nr:DUF2161 family putative PD-(D/E)XK-type phosphodiesterase [Roseovarius spongiae]RKF14203.1 hypothetical protein D6850_11665 [Roseovarius spongiae]